MASVTSNLPEVVLALHSLADCCNLSRHRRCGKSLGDQMADEIAVGIIQRTHDEQGTPDGGDLTPNQGRYGVTKRSMRVPVGIGLYGSEVKGYAIGGEMLSFEQVRGMVVIMPGEMRMEYGLDVENKDKAEWFTDGGPDQPPRPFYELNGEIEAKLSDLVDGAADDTVRDMGGA